MGGINRTVKVQWRGDERDIKCNFRFIDLVNQQSDMNALVSRVFEHRQALNHSQCATIISCAMQANDVPCKYMEVGEWVQDNFADAQKLATQLMGVAMYGHPKDPLPAATGKKKKASSTQ